MEAPPEVVAELRRRLVDQSLPMPKRYRALFSLRNLRGDGARESLIAALRDPSALLGHEVAFALGQMQDPASVPALHSVLTDSGVHPMVRHEAAEALGAIGLPECLEMLEMRTTDAAPEVAETCQLALSRIADQEARKGCAGAPGEGGAKSPFLSVDPAPAAPQSASVLDLRAQLLDESRPLFERYEALFGLRNRQTPEATDAVVAGLQAKSALLRHEVAYVLGQLQSDRAVQALAAALQDESEHAMVRHEAAEALGAIAAPACIELLRRFQQDAEPIVAQSCDVALDVLESEQAGEFQYADTTVQAQA